MGNYVSTLVKRIKNIFVKDLKILIGDAEPAEEVVKAVLMESRNSDKEQY